MTQPMSQHTTSLPMQRHRARPGRQQRDGVVLLIVLGMLSLFTVLAVTYVVFSSQMADSSFASQQRRLNEFLPDPPLDSAALQLIVGTNDSFSAAYGRSLMEDFYGTDGLAMRVGHRRQDTSPPSISKVVPNVGGDFTIALGQLLLPLDGQQRPQTTLFKFPTNLVRWYYDGAPAAVTPPPGVLDPVPPALRVYLDDAITGRIVAFDEGPLKNIPFRIVRSFGQDNGTTDEGDSVSTPFEYSLAGNLVIDLSEIGDEIITIDGVPERLYLVAANFPNRLLYGPGADEQPGTRGVDDDGRNGVDDSGELGWPGTDDIGFQFVLNGQIFNGQGINPGGTSGLVRHNRPGTIPNNLDSAVIDPSAEIEFTLNSRLTGIDFWGGTDPTAPTRPQFDESWDAADWENLFLAWQPSDHRRVYTAGGSNQVYTGVDSAELNRQMGQHIIPSFHRPAVINFLINAPIRIPGDVTDPTDPAYIERTFNDIKNNFQAAAPLSDGLRLQALVTRLRRATLRPLNFPHLYASPAASDFNGDGDPFDGAPFFSGSNPTPILNQQLDLSSPAVVIPQIELLARWLVNGPWDVDNDGDGLPDSVWVDLNLPTVLAPGGQLLKPMIAALIEDWDGRINLNHTGSYNQLINSRFTQGPYQINNDATYFAANSALDSFGRGGGIGPAEIDFSHLFAFEPGYNAGQFVGPIQTNQIGNPLSIDQVLRTRYGNLLNVRYGGQVYNYTLPYPYNSPTSFGANFLRFPGAGTRFNPQTASDVLARIPFNTRNTDHVFNSASGRPVDITGIGRTRKDRLGSHRFTDLPAGEEVFNQPYEFGAEEIRGDDAPFTSAEQIDLLRGGPLNGRLNQLLGDAADRNEAIRRLVATESRSVDLPELPGGIGVVHLFANKFGTPSAPTIPKEILSIQMQRMLAVEFRKGSKLNLNRPFGNANQDTPNPGPPAPQNPLALITDDTTETETILLRRSSAGNPPEVNTANNRRSNETAFPQIAAAFPTQAQAIPSYGPSTMGPVRQTTPTPPTPPTQIPLDFDGIDINGDGILDGGSLFDTDPDPTVVVPNPPRPGVDSFAKAADGAELLARHLYCLMFALVENTDGAGVLVPEFPYPQAMNNSGDPSITAIKNAYAAQRIAQWAANAVDYRDIDAKCTRLRYDPNPFDTNGFSLDIATRNTVWGMERPEAQLTEAIAAHDKRLKRNLAKEPDMADPTLSLDGESQTDDDSAPPTDLSDSDMDQFRIPQPSAWVEIQSLASPMSGNGETQPHYPSELYTSTPTGPALDLGRTIGGTVTVGGTTINRISPVWRVAVGESADGDPYKSSRFIFDADRLRDLSANEPEFAPDYLFENFNGGAIDWNDAAQRDAAVDTWNEVLRHSGDIRISPRLTMTASRTGDPNQTEWVSMGNDDFGSSYSANPSRIELQRFVWFAPLRPNNNLAIINDPNSGMRLNNVFYNKPGHVDATGASLSTNPLLQPGEIAVITPRPDTRFGQQTTSVAPLYDYFPSEQRLEFLAQGIANRFRLNYHGIGDVDPQTPNYTEDGGAGTPYHVGGVLPIICESLYPHEIDPTLTDWDTYVTGSPPEEVIDMGFNISAPLPGTAYYSAPVSKIRGTYPQIDGYRDYELPPASADSRDQYHPDTPFDHVPATAAVPMSQVRRPANGGSQPIDLTWAAVGTHEEAATIFLQRLADPTIAWHAVDNPYITVDFLPMDLTTLNGEHDVREEITKNVDDGAGGISTAVTLVDDKSNWNSTTPAGATNGFTPQVRFDSRRKIPDADKDRVITVLLPNTQTPATPPTLGERDRVAIAKRSALSMTTNALRPSNDGGASDFWPFELGSLWNNGSYSGTVDTSYGINGGNWLTFDRRNDAFGQTLGYVNREYGQPVDSLSPHLSTFGLGSPDNVFFNSVSWMDRDFQSPYDLMNVPASSRTSLLATFGPGSRLEDSFSREIAMPFEHLLGFDVGYANPRAEDMQIQGGTRSRLPLGSSESADGDFATFTGERAGFEQIFDYVDVGPVWFDSQRWFDPLNIRFRQDSQFDTASTYLQQVHQMFNRSVENLQPPYNYIGKHRTPGKINLNTTPDYIRRGLQFNVANAPVPAVPDPDFDEAQYLDGAFLNRGTNSSMEMEDPSWPGQDINAGAGSPVVNENALSFNPSNFPITPDGFTSEWGLSQLYGNGSVYRSFAWGISSPYELDVDPTRLGAPETMGEDSRYDRTVDSFFGRAFKGFIESRRGYSTSAPGSTFLGNTELDWRYPTRFAGAFSVSRASATPSVQRFMRQGNRFDPSFLVPGSRANPVGFPRRTHDMSIMRPHPDFDLRTLSPAQLADVQTPTSERFSLRVEDATAITGVPGSTLKTEVTELRMPMINKGLFDRSDAELHMNLRNLDRDSYFRHQNTARLANVTTHHSNVYNIRLTLGYFVVDPTTGAVGAEYVNETGEPIRSRGTYVVDRTIPVGFLRGKNMDAERTILYSEVEE